MSWRFSHFARSPEMYGGAVVGQQPWPMDPGLVERRGLQRHFERGGDVLGLHRGAQLPGDDVAGEVVEDRRQVEPSPADDLEISEVRLPELVWRRRLILELVRGLHHDEGWAGDQIVGLDLAWRRGKTGIDSWPRGRGHPLLQPRHSQASCLPTKPFLLLTKHD
jgi:hypothetical protein